MPSLLPAASFARTPAGWSGVCASGGAARRVAVDDRQSADASGVRRCAPGPRRSTAARRSWSLVEYGRTRTQGGDFRGLASARRLQAMPWLDCQIPRTGRPLRSLPRQFATVRRARPMSTDFRHSLAGWSSGSMPLRTTRQRRLGARRGRPQSESDSFDRARQRTWHCWMTAGHWPCGERRRPAWSGIHCGRELQGVRSCAVRRPPFQIRPPAPIHRQLRFAKTKSGSAALKKPMRRFRRSPSVVPGAISSG